jgi:tRNA-dihydrouridine synthase 3
MMAENGVDVPNVDGTSKSTPIAHLPQPKPPTPSKRKLSDTDIQTIDARDGKCRKGTAPIKAEYLVQPEDNIITPKPRINAADDDAAEEFHHKDRQPAGKNSKRREKNQGQNTNRRFGSSRDEVGLCSTRVSPPEFSPEECRFGDRCKFEHDLRRYLREHKREDLSTFGRLCPVWDVKGTCEVGWKCRFVGSHSKEIYHGDGRKELVLVDDEERKCRYSATSSTSADKEAGVVNSITASDRILLTKKKVQTPKSDLYLKWLDNQTKEFDKPAQKAGTDGPAPSQDPVSTTSRNSSSPDPSNGTDAPATTITTNATTTKEDNRALYRDPPLLPSEKRRLYFGPETPVLAPLTTQGNLPFRRLCTSLGATFTYSEMAMSLPLLQGHRPEWALLKAHESETQPPTFTNSNSNIVYDYNYNQSRDLRFGAQIAANKPWVALKATEILTMLLPRGLRLVDLNVGCPIDLVYREGAGSALMDSPGKLEKMLRGMNAVSDDVPITVKLRMGTKDGKPTAQKLVERLVLGDGNTSTGASGVAAVTLHGRSRQQRYTREANWDYIAETAGLIKTLNEKADGRADTVREVDERELANTHKRSTARHGKAYFLGNGDVYSHEHYNEHIAHAGVDTCMVARGALMKPWIFEEITQGQYLDKSSSQRLEYVEKFCRYGLEAWGSDEIGVGQTRRFLLEWLSFACRYVPVGLLEHLPPNIQDRPPRYRGRDELETLMASDNFRDWIKIRYVISCISTEVSVGSVLTHTGIARCSLARRIRTSGSNQSIKATASRFKLKGRKDGGQVK